jgi:hypothetical protein
VPCTPDGFAAHDGRVGLGLLAGLGLRARAAAGVRHADPCLVRGWPAAFALAAFAGLNSLAPADPLAHWAAMALVLWAACRLQFARQMLRMRHFAPRLDKVVLVLLAALASRRSTP